MNTFKVISVWADGYKQVEGFYDSLEDAQREITNYEKNPEPDYLNCVVIHEQSI